MVSLHAIFAAPSSSFAPWRAYALQCNSRIMHRVDAWPSKPKHRACHSACERGRDAHGCCPPSTCTPVHLLVSSWTPKSSMLSLVVFPTFRWHVEGSTRNNIRQCNDSAGEVRGGAINPVSATTTAAACRCMLCSTSCVEWLYGMPPVLVCRLPALIYNWLSDPPHPHVYRILIALFSHLTHKSRLACLPPRRDHGLHRPPFMAFSSLPPSYPIMQLCCIAASARRRGAVRRACCLKDFDS